MPQPEEPHADRHAPDRAGPWFDSLGDWKTAWDHIHFRGFLGTPIALQFTWQGCDSLLAAPLVLDLVRFTERERRMANPA
jgi:myo-inositol-1-phosphate synthase